MFNHTKEEARAIEDNIMSLADNMASAAASFNSHGYDMFITARDSFKEYLHDLMQETNSIRLAD